MNKYFLFPLNITTAKSFFSFYKFSSLHGSLIFLSHNVCKNSKHMRINFAAECGYFVNPRLE